MRRIATRGPILGDRRIDAVDVDVPERTRDRRDLAPYLLSAVTVVLILSRSRIAYLIEANGALATWLTVFVSIGVQALPFLVMRAVLSALIAVYVPADALARWLPQRPAAAVPVAGLSGMVLPGCECAQGPSPGCR